MNEKKNSHSNVVEFSQSKMRAKEFTSDLPVSDRLKSYLHNKVHVRLLNSLKDRYFLNYYPILKEFAVDHHIADEKERSLIFNLFWWRILCDMEDGNINYVNEFISENVHDFSNQSFVTSWLSQWEKATPRFYYVGYAYNDYTYVVVDILTTETFDIIVYDSDALPTKKGEVIMGTMLPIGDELYFPITDFYHFDLAANKEIVTSLSHYYEKHLEDSTMLQAFIHVLSVTLQIEQIISLEDLLH